MKNEEIKISVIIPTYKDWNVLEKSIRAIEEQSFDQSLFEVIVIDNDGTEKLPFKTNLKNFKLIVETKPGSYAARNKGIDFADGIIFAFTDSDCVPDINWLTNAYNHFKSKESIERIAGNVKLTFAKLNSSSWVEQYEEIFAFQQERNVEDGYSVTANLFVKREVFRKAGLFDTRLLSGGDVEWGKRATLKGINIIYDKDIIVYHPARSTMSELIKKTIRVYHGIEFTKINTHGTLLKLIYPLYILRPPINKISKANGVKKKLMVFFVEYLIRFTKVYAHYKAMFTKRLNRI